MLSDVQVGLIGC